MLYPADSTTKGAITLESTQYSIGQFAAAACVSLRTLRYYDRVGLLSPASRTPAGYRVYTQGDMMALQQILALKFLGFSLTEIRTCMRRDPGQIGTILARQRAMMRERRKQLDTIISAIEQAETLVESNRCDWQAIVRVIQVIQMEQQHDWAKKYFSDDSLQKMEELSQSSYSDEARQKLAQREWTETDQEQASARWAHVAAESKRLAAIGADPAGEEAQALAKLKSDLLFEFTQGDPEIIEGLGRFWQNHNSLPEDQQPLKPVVPAEVIPGSREDGARLLQRAMEIYQARQPGKSRSG
jgi:DNA-binding transcriptional MerR regulator